MFVGVFVLPFAPLMKNAPVAEGRASKVYRDFIKLWLWSAAAANPAFSLLLLVVAVAMIVVLAPLSWVRHKGRAWIQDIEDAGLRAAFTVRRR